MNDKNKPFNRLTDTDPRTKENHGKFQSGLLGRGSQTSRRGFLKTSATIASASALNSLPLAKSAHAAGSDVLRVGMIGCGGRNSGAAVQALNADPGARLVAMCDIFMDRVKAKRQIIQDQKKDQVQVDDNHCFDGFEGYKHVIESSDVVLIANAAKFHPFHTMAAVRAGRHVFTEKPHGIDPVGIKLMQSACDLAWEKSLCVVSGLHSRYHPGYEETINRIHDGAIGDIVSIEENFLRGPYGMIERKANLSELQWQCSTQYHFAWLSGDDVVQSLVHNLDRARWAMGEALPIKCHGLGGRSSMTDSIYGDVFDHHSVIYEFPNGTPLYAFCRTNTFCYDEYSSKILGSKGRASIMGCRIWGDRNWQWKGQVNPYQIEHDRLFTSIRQGKPINNGDYMVPSTMTAVMGQISCYSGREVTWDQINQSDFQYSPGPEDCRDGMNPPTRPGSDGSYPVYKPGKSKLV
ncbi:MAG TPA: Gfo/Idh/MocA family oxidoreductase [Verrucomicrobiales bacterium]|nr:Gfo/Idh/MocA family oxidoreductase [Verrucomicrobiales bacterium]HIL68613.1 Gfo/Idh/MocA family oxidoreductase [Verrucomicrobiota bacterium]